MFLLQKIELKSVRTYDVIYLNHFSIHKFATFLTFRSVKHLIAVKTIPVSLEVVKLSIRKGLTRFFYGIFKLNRAVYRYIRIKHGLQGLLSDLFLDHFIIHCSKTSRGHPKYFLNQNTRSPQFETERFPKMRQN